MKGLAFKAMVRPRLMEATKNMAERKAPSGNKDQASKAQAASMASVAMPALEICRRLRRSGIFQASLVSV